MGKFAMIIVFAAMLGSGVLMRSAKESSFEANRQQADFQEELMAESIARAGYNLAVGQVLRDFDAYTDVPTTSVVPYRGGNFTLTASGEGYQATVTSVGTFADKQHEITGVVEHVFPLNSTVYVAGNNVDVEYIDLGYTGNSFTISGEDASNPEGTVRAVVAKDADVVDALLDGLQHKQHDNIYGRKVKDDIYQGTPVIDLEKLVQKASAHADTTLNGGELNGNPTFGSPDVPEIVVIEDDAKINGNVQGYGLLLVEGDITLASGNFKWKGIVIAYGNDGVTVDFKGNADVIGSLVMIPEQFGQYDEVDEVRFYIGGDARLQYSSKWVMSLADDLTILDKAEQVKLVSESQRSL